MREIPKSGRAYRHFKGNIIIVLGVATHTETKEDLVVYMHNDKIWARPLDMFLSEVDHEKYPEVKQKYRFELQEIKSVAKK